jgi:hypothetical protein
MDWHFGPASVEAPSPIEQWPPARPKWTQGASPDDHGGAGGRCAASKPHKAKAESTMAISTASLATRKGAW